jgi:hypothetical protein
MAFIIHIGFHKTGSSATQEYMARDRDFLLAQGVDYPWRLCRFPSHGELPWSFLGPQAKWRDKDYDVDEVLTHFRAIVESNREKGIHTVVSNEDMSLLVDWPDQFAAFVEKYGGLKPVLVAYVRDPVDTIMSYYHHNVSNRSTKLAFADFVVASFNHASTDYRARLAPWIDAFGRDRVVVREYAKKDSATDFLEMLGLERNPEDAPQRANRGIHPWYSETYRKLPDGADGDKGRMHLRRASAEAPSVDALSYYLGDEVAEEMRKRYRGPYRRFAAEFVTTGAVQFDD